MRSHFNRAAVGAAFFMTVCLLIPRLSLADEALPPPPPAAPAVPSTPGTTFIWEDFELGSCYWGTQFEASVMDGGTISQDFPTSGHYCYRGHFILGPRGGRVAFSTSQAGDLTGATALTVDFYNSSPLTFTGSVILKQGPSWSWLKSPEIALRPGWNKNISFDLISLNPKTDLKQAAIVFETKESGEGFLYMDNLRLTGADPDKVIRYTTADRVTGTPVLVTGFEDGNCPFAPEKEYSSAIDTDVKLVQTSEGTHAAFFYFDNKAPDDRGSFVLQADMDLTAANGVVFDVYVPGKDPMDASVVLNTGAKWEYYESSRPDLETRMEP